MRLNQFLATAGVGSRRSVEELIKQSRVLVNGQIAELQTRVDPARDKVVVDGQAVKLPSQFTCIMLNKPRGYTVTRADPKAARTVYEILPEEYRHLAHIGRLDLDSEGLLLFTNNGTLNQMLLRPDSGVKKTYLAHTSDHVTKASEKQFVKGITLEDGMRLRAVEAAFTPSPNGGGILRIVLTEGKKREIRRMCQHLGITLLRLKRVGFGPVRLDKLPLGKTRLLTDSEVQMLEYAVSRKKAVPKPDRIP